MKHIFHHPVGVFPAAARWYLAGIAVVALLCIAMQLSIQDHAQQQAKALIHAWGERAHVHIGGVRYHLLRNGLILRDIQIQRGDDSVGISQILLRANPKLLTGNSPRIGVIDISDFNAELTRVGQTDIWQRDNYLRQIWQAASSITVHNGHIKLYMHGKSVAPLDLSDVSLRQRMQHNIRSIAGSARIQRGKVRWQWNMAETPITQQNQAWSSKGWLKWQKLDAGTLTASLALQPMAGHLNGRLTWVIRNLSDEHQASLNLRGDMQLDTGASGKETHAHKLQYVANKVGRRWKMDIEATAWPLGPWSDTLPSIGEHQLVSAQMDGKTHWQGYPGNWHIDSNQGVLQDVTYARSGGSDSLAWYWSRINYQHATIHTAKRQIQLAGADMVDSRLILQIKHMDMVNHGLDQQVDDVAGEGAITEQEYAIDAKKARVGVAKGTAWVVNADHVKVRNMMLALAMPQGNVRLESLDGDVRSPKGKALRFKLHTHKELSADKNTLPVGEKYGKELLQWNLRGRAEKDRHGKLVSAKIKIQGSHIPVSRLRPLLPLQDDAARPVKLAGDTSLKVSLIVDQNRWLMRGKASVQGLSLSHGGDVAMADQLNIRFGPIGTGKETQIINSIDSQSWQYIAALDPLPLHVVEHTESNTVAPSGAPWWVTTLRKNNIEITRINLKNGQISVGQQEALWAKHIDIEAANIQTKHWSNIAITGEVGGSNFHLKGEWQAISDVQRFRGDVGMEQAELFFLHNWMVASGMPRLIRGRLSVSLHLKAGQNPDSYKGAISVQLLQGLTEAGVFTSDPMLSRTGYNTSELLQRLEQRTGMIALKYNVSGSWLIQPLTLKRLGLSVQKVMHETAKSGNWRAKSNAGKMESEATIDARIRLHGRERLSLNERNRLFKVVAKFRKHPALMIDLMPKWTGVELTAEMQQRIRHTQQLIEHYMIHRKIDKRRIFSMWPTAGDRVEEIGSVQVEGRIAR